MIKRVNFTGRRRIPGNRVDVTVHDGEPRSFDAAIRLDGLSLAPHAAVFLEATCAGSTVIQRFDFGEAGHVRPPASRDLSELEGENVFFTLKVVDRTERFGVILGIAEHIRPEHSGKETVTGRQGILPTERVSNLGQQLWQLDFRGRGVFLLVNGNVPGLYDRVRSDPLFYSVIYPEVVRRILTSAIAEDAEPDEEDDRWPVMWLRFGRSLHPSKQEPPKPSDSQEDQNGWVEEVVEAFCEMHTLKDKFVAATRGEGGEA